MVELLSRIIGNDYISTLVMSLLPLIELKGGIVFARGVGFDFLVALALAFAGSTIVFVPLFFLLRPLLNLLKKIKWFNGFAVKVENYFKGRAEKALKKSITVKNEELNGEVSKAENSAKKEIRLKQLSVFIFVAIPLPMTGVWTGTVIAVFLGLKFKETVLPVVFGNLVAGLIISGLAELFLAIWDIAALDYVLYVIFGLALLLLAITLIKMSLSKKSKAEKGENGDDTVTNGNGGTADKDTLEE